MFKFRRIPKRMSVSVNKKLQLKNKREEIARLQLENAKRIKTEKEQSEKNRVEKLHADVSTELIQALPFKNQNKLCDFTTKTNLPKYVNQERTLNDKLTKTIVHVMNHKYGLGDYLRGSILLAQYAKFFNVNFNLDMSMHPLSKCLTVEAETLVREVECFEYNEGVDEMDVKLYSFIRKFINSKDETLYVSTNLNYNMSLVSKDIKDFINLSMCFKQEYYTDINLEKYRVLHIRCKDDCFNTDFNDTRLITEIRKLHLGKDTVVISNNYSLKHKLNKLFGFYFIDQETHHFAMANDISELKTTIIEYIILSKSYHTYCFSYYKHGSGFSEQCSILNNIPYSVTIL